MDNYAGSNSNSGPLYTKAELTLAGMAFFKFKALVSGKKKLFFLKNGK